MAERSGVHTTEKFRTHTPEMDSERSVRLSVREGMLIGTEAYSSVRGTGLRRLHGRTLFKGTNPA